MRDVGVLTSGFCVTSPRAGKKLGEKIAGPLLCHLMVG